MNKKGFTLVELLAVIVILSALAYISTTAIGGIFKKSKQEVYDTQLELVKSSAETWVSENSKYVQVATKSTNRVVEYILLSDLVNAGLMDNVNNPKTGEDFTNLDLLVKVTSEYSEEYGRNIIKYEIVDDKDEVAEIKRQYNHITATLNTDDLTTRKVYIVTYITAKNKQSLQMTVEEGESFTMPLPKITATEYPFNVSVTQNGMALTGSSYSYSKSNGVVSVPNVTGNIVITELLENFTVTYKYVTISNGRSSVARDTAFTFKYNEVPPKVDITMGGKLLSSSDYVYNSTDKTIKIPRVTGNIVVHGYYTVTFNPVGGSSVNSQIIKGAEVIPTAPTTSQAGYTFDGWYRDSSLLTPFKFGTDTITSNTMLYAKWTINKLTIAINKDGSAWSSSGMKINLSTSSSSDTASFTQTVSSGSAATLEKIVAGTTYYIWAGRNGSEKSTTAYTGTSIKGATSVSSSVNYYTITKSQGAGTTLTINYGNSSGTSLGTTQVLKNQSVYITGSLATGYKDLVIKYAGTVISSGTTKQVTAAATIASSATLNQFTCPAGQYLTKGATSCTTCPAGSYCPGGTYIFDTTKDQGKSTCASGNYTNTGDSTGASTCTACPSGSSCNGKTKTACAAGTYSGAGASSCTTCASGNYTNTGDSTGATSCTACPAGSSCNGKTKTACGAGKYSTAGSSSCSNISAGCYGTSGTTSCPTSCAAGTYSSAGASSCTTCASGNYTNTGDSTGATSCTACPAGSSCNGKTKTACGAGKYSTAGSSSCSNISAGCYGTSGTTSCPATCAAGTYSGAGASSCTTCPAGSYCTGGSNKTTCPTGKTSSAGAKSSSDCVLTALTVGTPYISTPWKSCWNSSAGWKFGFVMYASASTSSACSLSKACWQLATQSGSWSGAYEQCVTLSGTSSTCGSSIGDVVIMSSIPARKIRVVVTDSCSRSKTSAEYTINITPITSSTTSCNITWNGSSYCVTVKSDCN